MSIKNKFLFPILILVISILSFSFLLGFKKYRKEIIIAAKPITNIKILLKRNDNVFSY